MHCQGLNVHTTNEYFVAESNSEGRPILSAEFENSLHSRTFIYIFRPQGRTVDLLQAIFRRRVRGLWLWLGLGLVLVLIRSGFEWRMENSACPVYLSVPGTG